MFCSRLYYDARLRHQHLNINSDVSKFFHARMLGKLMHKMNARVGPPPAKQGATVLCVWDLFRLACQTSRLCCELLPSRRLSSGKPTIVPSSSEKVICSHGTALVCKWCMGVSTSGGLGAADGRLIFASMDGMCVGTKCVGGPWSCRWAPTVSS